MWPHEAFTFSIRAGGLGLAGGLDLSLLTALLSSGDDEFWFETLPTLDDSREGRPPMVKAGERMGSLPIVPFSSEECLVNA
jgi:hypothetical protein